MQLNEDFLHYIWQFRLLLRRDYFCTNGESLRIIHPGLPNTHAGPDFSGAKLQLGGQVWAGNLEIHVRSSDWLLHGHQVDQSYDSVILHVVYEDDVPICRTDGSIIPVLVLKDLIPEALLAGYEQLNGGLNFFPCAKQISHADPLTVKKMFQHMVSDRFREKADELAFGLSQDSYYWNKVCYELLMKNFGFKVNALPFELLAASLPFTILARHRDNALQAEALLFGQAGFLDGEFTDEYPKQLQSEYTFLRKKYQLVPVNKSLWKFMRMHPQNFPPLRIAQAAGLLISRQHLFANLLQEPDPRKLIHMFSDINVHPYWKNHSDFDRLCQPVSTRLGRKSIENLMINTVCLLLYTYGKYFRQTEFIERSIVLLKKIPAESNAITRQYRKAGLQLRGAYDSQAVLQLYKSYCSPKKCLNCMIGADILS
ncbi:DUF2851 family protein [Pedobacter sp. L105]|uniref:DUF2851 family protein n=1 Tax=Pedobacter sp. L105 TaxID=1641871 RepID=UPI00131B165B|nr:DUF2851 family protein [Pedobacter sp. L105]